MCVYQASGHYDFQFGQLGFKNKQHRTCIRANIAISSTGCSPQIDLKTHMN